MKKTKLFILIILFVHLLYGQSGSSPNFIFILADDQGWNGTSVKMMRKEPLSQSDYYQTPNLKKWASNAVIFSDAYAAAPVCAPSRYSIQFGKTPARLSLVRVGMNSDHIPHEKMILVALLLLFD